ncbi:hypothetical protein OAR19_00480 [bacterium]|nr:hypothetical protein [bacterium]
MKKERKSRKREKIKTTKKMTQAERAICSEELLKIRKLLENAEGF